MQSDLPTEVQEPPGPRLVVIGGSSAGGFGVPDGQSYASSWSRDLHLPISVYEKYGVRVRDAMGLLQDSAVSEGDLVVLHLGLVDATLILPRRVRRVLRPMKSGRGDPTAADSDRRLYSRVRRRSTEGLETLLTNVCGSLGLLQPVQNVSGVRRHFAELDGHLASFGGLLVCILSDRGPNADRNRRLPAADYREALVELVYRRRLDRELPAALLDLRGLLRHEHYLQDGFHPNAEGHELIATAGITVIRSALARAQ